MPAGIAIRKWTMQAYASLLMLEEYLTNVRKYRLVMIHIVFRWRLRPVRVMGLVTDAAAAIDCAKWHKRID